MWLQFWQVFRIFLFSSMSLYKGIQWIFFILLLSGDFSLNFSYIFLPSVIQVINELEITSNLISLIYQKIKIKNYYIPGIYVYYFLLYVYICVILFQIVIWNIYCDKLWNNILRHLTHRSFHFSWRILRFNYFPFSFSFLSRFCNNFFSFSTTIWLLLD